MKLDFQLAEYLKDQGINPRDGYDADDYYEWKAARKDHAEWERLQPMREEQARRWEQQKHVSVLAKAQEWAGQKVGGFVVFIGDLATSIHRDKAEAQELARAQEEYHRGVRIRAIKITGTRI